MAAFTSPDPARRDAFMAKWARILADPAILARAIVCESPDGVPDVAGHVASFVRAGDGGEPDRREVTYWLGRSFWNQGIATRALADFLRIESTRPLWARAAKDNGASLRVLEKCGFGLRGHGRYFSNARGEEVDEAMLILE
jgi:RimJ/RimL family protein N-acetyltransferase